MNPVSLFGIQDFFCLKSNNVEGTKRSVYLRESPKMMEEPRIEMVR